MPDRNKIVLTLPEDVLAIPNLPAHLLWRTADKSPRVIESVGVQYQLEPDGAHETETFPVGKPGDAKAAQAVIDKEVAPLLRELFGAKPEAPEAE